MKLVTKALSWVGGVLAGIVGALIAIAMVVALVTQSIPTGIKASITLAHYGVTMTGGVLSYADNVGPDLNAGKALGNKALPNTAAKAPAKTKP